jgi:GNAT superfamily N-acetyltransferase
MTERTGTRDHIEVVKVPLDEILGLREEYRREMGCQIVHDSWHSRGFTNSYALRVHDKVVGYGSVGGPPRDAKDIVKEFFVQRESRGEALPLFRQLIAASGARRVEAQTNDSLLLLMLHDCVDAPWSDTVLFSDGATTALAPPAPRVVLRRVTEEDHDRVFPHTVEPVGEWGLESNGELVATGGLAFHYNPPYGDIYMEVAVAYRMMGFGSYLVQELKRLCYEMKCVPSARCSQANVGSRRTLQRAGMFPCARILQGELRT